MLYEVITAQHEAWLAREISVRPAGAGGPGTVRRRQIVPVPDEPDDSEAVGRNGHDPRNNFV